jgi:hypothetical protein
MRDFSERQSQLFLVTGAFLVRYQPPALHLLTDADVAEAADALAATFETAARGIIYEPRPTSAVAEHLATALKPLLADAGKSGGTAFEREAAVVLRRLGGAAREMRTVEPRNDRALLELLGRVIAKGDRSSGTGGGHEASRLIVS